MKLSDIEVKDLETGHIGKLISFDRRINDDNHKYSELHNLKEYDCVVQFENSGFCSQHSDKLKIIKPIPKEVYSSDLDCMVPTFAKVGNTAMRFMPEDNEYFRDGGYWSVGIKKVNGDLLSNYQDDNKDRLSNMKIISCSRYDWEKSNGQYAPTDSEMKKYFKNNKKFFKKRL